MTDPLGVAVLGASGHAARVAAPTIARTASARLTGVLGSSPESSSQLAGEHERAIAFAEWHDLLGDDATKAVWVAGPNNLHAEFARRCLEGGKHVFVEKPLATSADDAADLAALADERGLTLGVDYQHRFRSGHRWLREQLRTGAVGDVHLLRIHRFWAYPYFADMPPTISGWRASTADSGGWALNDIGSHLVDLALWLLERPARLAFSRTSNFRFDDVDAEDTAVLVLDADRATVVVETSNAMSSWPGTIEVHGSAGWIRTEGTFDDEGWALDSAGARQEFRDSFDGVYAASFADFVGRVGGSPGIGADGAAAVATTSLIRQAADQHVRR